MILIKSTLEDINNNISNEDNAFQQSSNKKYNKLIYLRIYVNESEWRQIK